MTLRRAVGCVRRLRKDGHCQRRKKGGKQPRLLLLTKVSTTIRTFFSQVGRIMEMLRNYTNVHVPFSYFNDPKYQVWGEGGWIWEKAASLFLRLQVSGRLSLPSSLFGRESVRDLLTKAASASSR